MFILISRRPSVVAAVLVERGLASTNPVLRPVLAYDQRAGDRRAAWFHLLMGNFSTRSSPWGAKVFPSEPTGRLAERSSA